MEISGTTFPHEWPESLCKLVARELALKSHDRTRYVVEYEGGDEGIGYFGQSCGPIKVPLLSYNRRSYGGVPVGDNVRRLRLSKGKRVVWDYARAIAREVHDS